MIYDNHEDSISTSRQPNIFNKVWGSLFGQADTSNLDSALNTQELNNYYRQNKSKNLNDWSDKNRNHYLYSDDEDDQNYEDTRSQFSVDSSRTNNSMGVPPMSPSKFSHNDSYYSTNIVNNSPYRNSNNNYLNSNGSELNTPFSLRSRTTSPYERNITHGYDDDDDMSKIDDTLRIINESMARWNLRPGSSMDGFNAKIGAFPIDDLKPQLPQSKETADQLIKRINANNKKINHLITVSRDFVEKEEYMKLKLEFSKMKEKYEKLRAEFKLEVESGQRIADGYNELLKSHGSLNQKYNTTTNKLKNLENDLNDANNEIQNLSVQNNDLKVNNIKYLKEIEELKKINNQLEKTSVGLNSELKNDYYNKCNEVRILESEKRVLEEELKEKELQAKLFSLKPPPLTSRLDRKRPELSFPTQTTTARTTSSSGSKRTPTDLPSHSPNQKIFIRDSKDHNENALDEIDPNDTIDELMKIYPDKIMPMSEVDTGISYPKVSFNWTRTD